MSRVQPATLIVYLKAILLFAASVETQRQRGIFPPHPYRVQSKEEVEMLAAKSWLFLVLFPNNWPSHNAQATAICGHYCHVSLTVCRS